MSKKFKNKLCVYCSKAQSTSADHVLAREFFLPRHRGNLLKVPACGYCNGEKGKLENYFGSLLPFGGRHPEAKENLVSMVPRRLRNNARLHRDLFQGQGAVWDKPDALIIPAMTLPIDSERFVRLFQFIGKGLIWHHWRAYLTDEHFVKVWTLNRAGDDWFDRRLFHLNANARVTKNLGAGAFTYEGAQGVDCPEITVWRLSMYGGVRVSDDLGYRGNFSSRINIVTGPRSADRYAMLASKFCNSSAAGLRLD